MHKKLVLASQSPRRRELVTKLGVAFNVVSPNSDETLDSSLTVEEQIERISEEKALSVFDNYQDCVVLGSDTVVVFNGEVLGKPKNEKEAKETLMKLSGSKHDVITGVCLVSSECKRVFSVKTEVEFFELTEAEIDAYVATKEPLDKAGSYSIQGFGSVFVKGIMGDFYSVMGLPISQVNQELIHNQW